eukprot:scaffold458768_cov14-Prasinocladus_malaysianus.AAC.1
MSKFREHECAYIYDYEGAAVGARALLLLIMVAELLSPWCMCTIQDKNILPNELVVDRHDGPV